MHDAIDDVGRVGMGRCARGLEAAALIDGNVYEYGAGLHPAELVAADESRRGAAGNQHGTDDQVCFQHLLLDRLLCRSQGLEARAV